MWTRVSVFSTIWRIAVRLMACACIFVPSLVFAATFQATASPASVSIRAGETMQITLKFKNVGTADWVGSREKTAVYLYGSSSVFGHASWLGDDLPAVISQASVKPGQYATATFTVRAPSKPGTYTEKFLLSSAPNVWIKGSTKTVTFVVKGAMSKEQQTLNTTNPPQVSNTQSAVPSGTLGTVGGEKGTTVAGVAEGWKAELADMGGVEWQVDPDAHMDVVLAFKNIGSVSWTRDQGTGVVLSTGGRASAFKDFSWKSESVVVGLKEDIVKPGQIGHFALQLRGAGRPGNYRESFRLALADGRAITGAEVTLPIRVTMPRDFIAKGTMNGVDENLLVTDSAAAVAAAKSGAYKATLLLRSAKELTLLGNGRQSLTFGYKNIGTAAWQSLSFKVAGLRPALTAKWASVRDESWLDASMPSRATASAAPGQIGFIGFTIKAPAKKGTYTASFQLYADDQRVEDGLIEIPITVTADGYIEPEPTPQSTARGTQSTSSGTAQSSIPVLNPIPLNGDASSLPDEPIIRVGLFQTTDDTMVVRAVSGGFSLLQNGSAVCRFAAGESVTVIYDRANAVSKASGSNCTTQSSGYYVAVPDDGLSPLELTDFNRPVSWLPGANDNKFRGKLELRYAKATNSVWIINELPIEWYLKGLGETSNSSPQEYQRALLTAARTYAMYHVTRGSKHADENYIVDAKYDQVYRGYGAEARDPNVVAAVDATRGQIVTYQGKLAITPYYSRSDGRTRSWTEVWGGGPYAWLVSVPVSWDNGRTLWGHGVGMSATGALGMAADGWTYDRILTYFYTGIELRKAYR